MAHWGTILQQAVQGATPARSAAMRPAPVAHLPFATAGRQVDNVAHWGDILQLAVLELIRKVCRGAPAEKGRHMKTILALLQSTSTAVVYECAVTLVSLSQVRPHSPGDSSSQLWSHSNSSY